MMCVVWDTLALVENLHWSSSGASYRVQNRGRRKVSLYLYLSLYLSLSLSLSLSLVLRDLKRRI